LKQAKIHFHLEANAQLDALENEIMKRTKSRRGLVRGLAKEWRVASLQKDQGEWEKIQKRFYRLAGLIRAKFLRKRAVRDLLNAPTLTERIADYMRCSGSVTDYLKFMRRVVAHREHVHEDVELILVESLLRLEASGIRARSLLKFGLGVLEDVVALRKSPVFANPACLVVLRFGGRRTITQLRRFFREEKLAKQAQLIRASAIAYSTYGLSEFREIRKAAAVLLSNPLALMVRMIKKIQGLNQVTDRFKARLNLRRDPVGGRFYLDMRTYVAGRLLRLNKRTAVSTWLQQWAGNLVTKRISSFDRKLIRRLVS
jgi:hypothetical protein